jgi:hypothetical protein
VVRLHMDHVWAHVERLRSGQIAVPEPGAVFLGAEDGESFQELIAFRMAGMTSVGLAVFSFRSHGLPGVPHARESLASYLSNPPMPPRSGPFAAPTGSIGVLLPRTDESIPQALKSLRGGRPAPSLVLDPRRIHLCLDFRAHNPSSREVVKRAAGRLDAFVLRTVEGHVLTCRSASMGARAGEGFVALTEVVQVTPRGTLKLPDLILNASWIGMWAQVTDENVRIATGYWAPFLASEAHPDIVLGPLPAPATKRPEAGRAATPRPAKKVETRPSPPDKKDPWA